jgi:lysophospholipase L1-like esterase
MSRSQRHLREVQGYDSTGDSDLPVDAPEDPEPPLIPLQVVTSRGEVHHARAGARTASNNLQIARTRHYIGSVAVSELRPVFQDFYIPDTPLAETNGEGYRVRFNIEYNDVSVPGYFDGERDGVVPAGSDWFMADPVLPSSFGVSEFPANAMFWLRAEREYAVGAGSLFSRTTAYNTPIPSERYMSAPAGTSSLLNATGPLVTGGGWSAQTHVWLPFCIVGRPVSPMMAVGMIGASIEHGSNDTAGDGETGGGWMRRAMFSLGGNKIARASLAKPGESALEFLNSHTKRAAVLPYLTHVFIGYGGNDYTNGSSLSTTLGRLEDIWEMARTARPASHLAQIAFAPKTDSTDAWATVANQTPRPGFAAAGGDWYAANATMAADPRLDGFVNVRSAMVDATAVDKWKAPGATTDGTHPSSTIHVAMASAFAAILEPLRVAHEES